MNKSLGFSQIILIVGSAVMLLGLLTVSFLVTKNQDNRNKATYENCSQEMSNYCSQTNKKCIADINGGHCENAVLTSTPNPTVVPTKAFGLPTVAPTKVLGLPTVTPTKVLSLPTVAKVTRMITPTPTKVQYPTPVTTKTIKPITTSCINTGCETGKKCVYLGSGKFACISTFIK